MIHKLIETTTSAASTGLPTQHKLFRVPSGPFAGRTAALYNRTPSVLSLSYADPPFTTWIGPGNFITDSADQPFAAVMDGDGHLYVAYTQETSEALRCAKLVYANGTWGTETPVTVYDSGTSANLYPSLLKDDFDRIWVVWTRNDGGTFSLRSKHSIDDGQTFGAGSTDAGTDISGDTTACFGLLIARTNRIHCLYTIGTTTIKNRDRDLGAALWSQEETLYTGTGLGADYSAGVAADGTLGCLFGADSTLFLKEYDGAVWGALQTVADQAAESPSLRYIGTAPYALFLRTIGGDQKLLVESHRVDGEFATASPALSQMSPFACVLCYDAGAPAPYADLTVEAAESSGADVLHPTSGALFNAIGDGLYLGANDRFSFVRVVLSTSGVGGSVVWSYWNGSEWVNFVPDSGAYQFDQANTGVRLFVDSAATPASWQKTVVNGANRYWIRAMVDTAFTTAPVGSQLTAVPLTEAVIPLR